MNIKSQIIAAKTLQIEWDTQVRNIKSNVIFPLLSGPTVSSTWRGRWRARSHGPRYSSSQDPKLASAGLRRVGKELFAILSFLWKPVRSTRVKSLARVEQVCHGYDPSCFFAFWEGRILECPIPHTIRTFSDLEAHITVIQLSLCNRRCLEYSTDALSWHRSSWREYADRHLLYTNRVRS